jgi:chromosome segregation and condensation protein ScpB
MTEPIDILEALLFASDTPVELVTVREVLELPSPDAARDPSTPGALCARTGGRLIEAADSVS